MMASDQERQAAKLATARAIVRWTIIKATERAEIVGETDGTAVFDAEDLIMFWCEVAPEVPMLLLKAGAEAYMDVKPAHAPVRKIDNSPQAIMRRMAANNPNLTVEE